MKIEIKTKYNPMVFLGDVGSGYVFKYNAMFYIKTEKSERGSAMCITLGAGLIEMINQWVTVEVQTNAKLVIGDE